jgi:hypothetical protein
MAVVKYEPYTCNVSYFRRSVVFVVTVAIIVSVANGRRTPM